MSTQESVIDVCTREAIEPGVFTVTASVQMTPTVYDSWVWVWTMMVTTIGSCFSIDVRLETTTLECKLYAKSDWAPR